MIRFFKIFPILFFTVVLLPVTAQAKDKGAPFDESKVSERILNLKKQAYITINLCNYKEAIILSDSLKRAGSNTADEEYAFLHSLIISGQANTMLGNPEEAYRSLQDALIKAKRMNYPEALGSVYNGLAIYNQCINNDMSSAIADYYSALEQARLTGNKGSETRLLANLSGAYFNQKDPECIKLALQSLDIAQEIKDTIAMYFAYLNLSDFSIWQHERDKAVAYLSEARRYADDNDVEDMIDELGLEARLHQTFGDNKEALAKCEKMMEMLNDNINIFTTSSAYLIYASVLSSNKEYDKALQIAHGGLDLVRSKGSHVNELEFINELIKIYKAKGDKDKALEYSNLAIDLRDSTYSASRERSVAEARIKFEVYEKEQTIDNQRRELAVHRSRVVALSVGIILVIVILSLVVINYLKKKKLYKSIVNQHQQSIQREEMLMEELEKHKQKKTESKVVVQDKNDSIMASLTALMMQEKVFTDPSISLNVLAEKLGTNRTYLSRAINDSTGKTFSQFVNEFRIREAIALMGDKEANYPLKEISWKVGFSSISTFYSTFTSATGMSPAKYRDQMKDL